MEFKQGKWSLSELYPEAYKAQFEADKKTLLELTENFEKHREILKSDISEDTFRGIMAENEKIIRLIYRMMSFCELKFSEDTQNAAATSLIAQTEALTSDVSCRTMFFDLWWKSLDKENAERLMKAVPENAYSLHTSRLTKEHVLSEKEEQIISIKDTTGNSALTNIYASLTNRYIFKLNICGEEKELTRGELMSYAKNADPKLREAAYRELYRVYEKDGNILCQIYQAITRDWDQEALHFRKYAAPISVRNISNDISDEVVDLLLETCRKNRGLFEEYFKLKKKLLKTDELHRWDLYAPINEEKKEIPFNEGLKTVLEAYNAFDPDFAKMAESVYNQQHIDSEVRHGKRGGAFCLTAGPDLTPWVLINYQNKIDDVSTLAHELGHAMHSISAEDKTILEQEACLPLAETASTFGEMLLADYLEKNENDKNVIISMLMKQLDDNYATIQRQAYFALFEKKAHQMVLDGADVNELNEAYMENLKEQFGDSMIVDDFFKWEWVSIPHIFNTPFYVYAYAFGQLLVLSLYRQYKKEGKSFIPKYKEMLHKGGSQKPAELLLDAGFDFTQESFWQGGFDVLKEKLERLKTLIEV